jgi:hypothetical protein
VLTLSRDIDEHLDPGLLAQLRAPLDLHDVSQQCCYHCGIMLVRSPRGWHSRKGTFSLSLSSFPPDHSSRVPILPAAVKLAAQVLDHSTYFLESLTASLIASSIPPHILSLPAHLRLQPSMTQPPTPIIPLLTPRARALSAYLLAHGLNALPMSFPTVPKGTDRVRVCLHAGNTRAELDRLVSATVAWAVGFKGKRDRIRGMDLSGGGFLGSKL